MCRNRKCYKILLIAESYPIWEINKTFPKTQLDRY